MRVDRVHARPLDIKANHALDAVQRCYPNARGGACMAGTDINPAQVTKPPALPAGIVRKTVVIIALNLACYVVMYCLNAVLARVMSTRDYGMYGLIVNTLITIGTFALFGFDDTSEFFISVYASLKKHDLLRGFFQFLAKIFVFVATPFVLISLVFIVVSFMQGKLSSREEALKLIEASHPLVLFIWIAPFLGAMACLEAVLYALGAQIQTLVYRGIVGPLVMLISIGGYYYLFGREHMHYAVYAYCFSILVTIGLQAATIVRRIPTVVWAEKPKRVVKTWVTYAIPIFLCDLIYFGIDTSVMGEMHLFHLNKEYLGLYMAISSISGYFLVSIMSSIASVFEVYIGPLWEQKDFRSVQSLINKALAFSIGFCALFCLFVVIAGHKLLENFGPGYVEAYPALLIYTISASLNAGTIIWQSLLKFTDNVKYLLKVYIAGFVVLLIGVGFGCYRQWSLDKILWAYAAFQVVTLLVCIYYVRKAARPISLIPVL